MRVDYIKDISTLCKISLLFHVFQINNNPPWILCGFSTHIWVIRQTTHQG